MADTLLPSFAPPDGYRGPKRSLLLAGGGMRVAYQAGVLLALKEEGLCFHHGDGTSGGTINLAMLFSGLAPQEMIARWKSLDVKDFATLLPPEDYVKSTGLMALGGSDGLRKKVFPHLGIDPDKIRRAQGMAATFNLCDFSAKVNKPIPQDQVTLDHLVAGVSLPIFMPPVEIDGDQYVDSVWIKDTNLMEAVKRGAEELWLVWCIGNSRPYKAGMFNQYVHMIELSANGVLFEEFDRIRDLNERIARGEPAYGQTRPIRLHVIKPAFPLPLDPDFYFGRIDAATLIDKGYMDAKKYLSTRGAEGLAFTPEVTQMQDNVLGLTFRETMAGGFSLGAADPQAGQAAGKKAGTVLSMHANVEIRDLKRFIADPDHLGELTGTIDYAPFGQGIPAKSGVFNLFSPTGDPKLRLMVYELGFEVQGKDYYLAGQKDVKTDSVLELWKETTTLYTTLYQGKDKSGPVAGAGILSLGFLDLLKLAETMTVTDAATPAQSAEGLLEFGRFFMGELWDTYVLKKAPPPVEPA
jgi:predicted acylesterase/phospholipase RssA